MNNEEILKILKVDKSIFLIGVSNSGKTHFLKNELLPFFNNEGYKIAYFESCNEVQKTDCDFVIVDEVESLQDINFLEEENNAAEYYSEDYLGKIYGWFEKLKEIEVPGIFVLTRNSEEAINNFKKNINTLDWNGKPAEVLVFSR